MKAKPKGNEPKQARRHVGASTRRTRKPRQVPAQVNGHEPDVIKLAEHAEAIRSLGKLAITNIIEIGRRLTEAKRLLVHGKWAGWLADEFGWSAGTALNFMRVYELAEDYKSKNFSDLRIAPSALYALSKRNTPPEVRDEIIERAEAGEKIGINTVQEALQATLAETGDDASTTDDVQETPPAADKPSPADTPPPPAEEPWQVIEARRWCLPATKLAKAIVQYGQLAAEYLVLATLRQALGDDLEQTIATFRDCAEVANSWVDAMERALAPPPSPMFDDTPGDPTQTKH